MLDAIEKTGENELSRDDRLEKCMNCYCRKLNQGKIRQSSPIKRFQCPISYDNTWGYWQQKYFLHRWKVPECETTNCTMEWRRRGEPRSLFNLITRYVSKLTESFEKECLYCNHHLLMYMFLCLQLNDIWISYVNMMIFDPIIDYSIAQLGSYWPCYFWISCFSFGCSRSLHHNYWGEGMGANKQKYCYRGCEVVT